MHCLADKQSYVQCALKSKRALRNQVFPNHQDRARVTGILGQKQLIEFDSVQDDMCPALRRAHAHDRADWGGVDEIQPVNGQELRLLTSRGKARKILQMVWKTDGNYLLIDDALTTSYLDISVVQSRPSR